MFEALIVMTVAVGLILSILLAITAVGSLIVMALR